MENVQLSVGEFVDLVNQTLQGAYPSVSVVGEVAEFRVSQGKWVTFKLKDDEAVVECFIPLFTLRQPIENGMIVLVVAEPRLNGRWGKFSLNVKAVKPVGEGSIKKSFELLVAKLEKEGLFDPERKRPLPRIPERIAVISSTEAAGYADFIKIIGQRWGGLTIEVAHTQVQGLPAAGQISRAIQYFNQQAEPADVLVIIRGGGSADDLMTFNDEPLARAIAASRIPTLVGVGHEVDHTLADMVADRRAATPSNAAEIIVPDKREVLAAVTQQLATAAVTVERAVNDRRGLVRQQLDGALASWETHWQRSADRLDSLRRITAQLDPAVVLRRGYAILGGPATIGKPLEIETYQQFITTEVTHVRSK